MGKVLDTIRDERLKTIRTQVESYCDSIMSEYLNDCKLLCDKFSLSSNHTKNFNDSVWGTIELNEGEIFIIDSPIVQRLRKIKQLGLADLLYSSADHSRYSHTLGVIRTADVMQKQIEKELSKKDISTSNDTNQLIRLAAIFHDCGHTFCSHASEVYFQNTASASLYDEISKERNFINQSLSIKPSLSEMIAVFIVQSKSVRDLLSIVASGLKGINYSRSEEDCIIEKICCYIWGYPYSEKSLPYSQIISGQIDADKLDYLKRDSYSTGVPAAVDMTRVFQKLRVVGSSKKCIMKSTSLEDVSERYTIAIAPVAINTVDQLIISRYMMFENVYFHQKTLTAESILRYALKKLDSSTEGLLDDFSNILRLKDHNIISDSFKSLLESNFKSYKVKDENLLNEACVLLDNLYKRKLFKRSVAFTKDNLIDVGNKGEDFYDKIFSTRSPIAQEKFVELIKQTTINIKKILESTGYHFEKETDILLIVSPDISNVNINSNLAIAEKNNKFRDMEFEADNWLKSRSSRKPQNFLVTYPSDRYIVYIATEYVLLKEYGYFITDSIVFDENDIKQIDSIKALLNKNDFYSDAYPIAPNNEIDIHNRDIEKLVNDDWKSYELISVDNGFPFKMDASYLKLFLKQFYMFENTIGDYTMFLSACIEMLKKVEIISKEIILNSLLDNFKHIQDKEQCSNDRIKVCHIGSVQDGSAQIAYQINQIKNSFNKRYHVQSLQEALEISEEGQVIVFIEDAFCSGKQILSIFETYMGVPIDERQTSEIHVSELSDENKDKLKNSKLYFSFIMYNKENEEYFKQRLAEIGLDNVEIVASKEFPKKYFDGSIDDKTEILRKYFEAAGKMLIGQKAIDENGKRKSNWSDERMKNSYLGYNDAQQLTVFAWNTPTYTLTPLWMSGNDEHRWYPLFPRIDK